MAARQWTSEWHKKQVELFKEERPVYELYARVLESMLAKACRALTCDGQASSRAKGVISFAEKAIRKAHKYSDPVHQLTDLCGGRTVTYTQAEADRIKRFVEANFVVDRQNTEDAAQRLSPSQFGYRAFHFVVQMPWLSLLGLPEFAAVLKRMEQKWQAEFSGQLKKTGGLVADEVLRQVLNETVVPGGVDLWSALSGVMTSEGAAILKEVVDKIVEEDRAGENKYGHGAIAVVCDIGNRKAEIQVCTQLQHAWAAIFHDRVYKSDFNPPSVLERQLHRVSALLEESDEELGRAISEFDEYRLDYGAYMNEEQLEEEIVKWEAVEKRAPSVSLALKIAALAIAAEKWDKVIEVLSPHRAGNQGNPALLRDLGLALGKRDRTGRDVLTSSVHSDPQDAAAHCYLGDTYCYRSETCPRQGTKRKADCARAMTCYASAFKVAQADPLALRKYLECKICCEKDLRCLSLLRPTLDAAFQKCADRTAIRVHLPQALYEMGEFAVLLSRPFESLKAYAKAVYLSDSQKHIVAAIDSLEKIRCGLPGLRHGDARPDWEPAMNMAVRFLLLAQVAKAEQLARQAPERIDRRKATLREAQSVLETRRDELKRAEEARDRLEKTPPRPVPLDNGRQLELAAIRALKEGSQELRDARDVVADAASAVEEAKLAVRQAKRALTQCRGQARKASGKVEEARRDFLRQALSSGSRAKAGPRWLRLPVVIVAGSCAPRFEQDMQSYRDLLIEGFHGFRGTVSSAGTAAGIGRIVGDIQEKHSGLRTVGYVPGGGDRASTQGEKPDARYTRIFFTEGKEFSPLEPLQSWLDLLAWGVRPCDVKVLGIDGGPIASVEYRIALALGARVGLLEGGGREAARLLADEDWRKPVMVIPEDAMVIQEYLRAGHMKWPPQITKSPETVAKDIHNGYLALRKKEAVGDDPALVEWEKLPLALKESNRRQAEHIAQTLRAIRCSICSLSDQSEHVIEFEPDEVSTMAKVEHARFVVERLMDGWKLGPKDTPNKINPTLIAWEELPENVKEYDRNTVRKILKYLAKAGLAVKRNTPPRRQNRAN